MHGLTPGSKGPIFVVGMPRSGTTFFQRVVTEHPDLCTTTRATREFPTSPRLCRLMRKLGKSDAPGEGGHIWDRFLRYDHDVLMAEDVSPRARKFYQAVLRAHMELYGKPHFLTRYPANGLRIPFFESIYIEPIFVHIIRDGRAVCQSVLRMREKDVTLHTWWGVRPPNWRDLEKLSPVESVARQWIEVVQMIRSRGEAIPSGRYMELRYEDLAVKPEEELDRFCRHCGITFDPAVAESLDAGIKNRNYKWRQAFSESEVKLMNGIMNPLLSELGYDDN